MRIRSLITLVATIASSLFWTIESKASSVQCLSSVGTGFQTQYPCPSASIASQTRVLVGSTIFDTFTFDTFVSAPATSVNIIDFTVIGLNGFSESGEGFSVTLPFTQPGTYLYGGMVVDNLGGVGCFSGNCNEVFSLTFDPSEFIAQAVPEPSTWAMLLIGFVAIGFASYSRRRTKEKAAAHHGGLLVAARSAPEFTVKFPPVPRLVSHPVKGPVRNMIGDEPVGSWPDEPRNTALPLPSMNLRRLAVTLKSIALVGSNQTSAML
jgi:PEP-CTERM motif